MTHNTYIKAIYVKEREVRKKKKRKEKVVEGLAFMLESFAPQEQEAYTTQTVKFFGIYTKKQKQNQKFMYEPNDAVRHSTMNDPKPTFNFFSNYP